MIKAGVRWVFLIVGTTIGAGYASGRELWQFFGEESELAIFIFFILFSLSCYAMMFVSYDRKAEHYTPVLEQILGRKYLPLFDGLLLIYLFVMTIVMIAGSGAIGQGFNHASGWGIMLIAMMLIILFARDLHDIIKLNQLMIPLLLIGLMIVLLSFIKEQNIPFSFQWNRQRNWLTAFPFTALNILPLTAVIGAIGHKIKSKVEIHIACLGSSFILGSITFIYNQSLIHVKENITLYEIPLFAILKDYPFVIHMCMVVLLWFAIYTTAASGMMGIMSRIKVYFQMPVWQLTVVLLCMMVPFSLLGFSSLIKYIYPLFGVLNLYILAKLLIHPIWKYM